METDATDATDATDETEEAVRGTPRDALAKLLARRPDLVEVAGALFDYTQYLLDDDQRLTKGGALDGQGRELLKARALELLGGPERATHDDQALEDEQLDDDSGDGDDE